MATTLIRNASVIATCDDADRLFQDADIRIRDNRIEAIGADVAGEGPVDEVIDASGHILIPGMVNTHHHFYQTLTRNLPAGQDSNLFNWLVAHYPIWARLDGRAIEIATRVAIAELMLSGCTTAADHAYLNLLGEGRFQIVDPHGERHGNLSVSAAMSAVIGLQTYFSHKSVEPGDEVTIRIDLAAQIAEADV